MPETVLGPGATCCGECELCTPAAPAVAPVEPEDEE